ncbi:trichohyalin-like [Cydia amplana]|uniref:trichohyalin-like n=1 Tax=Cydia amplana TaxID=1869771 RepID=UPI002FE51D14
MEDVTKLGTETGEVLILRNTRDVDLKIEELTTETDKKTITCPRCIKMIERAKSLIKDLPPAKIHEVAGVCDHCYQKELFPCPCCDEVVNKFLKFCLEEERKTQEYRKQYKSWLSKTQLSLKKSVSNIKDGRLESQAPVSRYIPTMSPGQEPAPFAIYDKPRFENERELFHEQKHSFLHISEEEKQRVKGESELDREKKKRQAEENVAKALKSVSFDALSIRDMQPTLIKVKGIKVISTIEKDKPSTPIIEEHIQSQPTMEQDIETTKVMQKMIIPKPEIETYSKPLTEKYTKPQSTMEKKVKLKSIMKKGAVKKPPREVFPEDDTTPQRKRKLQGSIAPTTKPSFGSIIKTLSEPNVSNFSYTFPRDKTVTRNQLKGHVSSSELIKSTQDMLDERKETERKKKEETGRKLEEEQKQKTAEKTMQIVEESKKLEEGRLLDEERKKREEGRDIKSEERIVKESDQSARRRKQDGKEAMDASKKELSKQEKELRARKDEKEQKIDQGQTKIKQRDEKQRDAEGTSALKKLGAKQAKDKSEEEKLRKQQQKDVGLAEKRATQKEQEKLRKQQEKEASLGKKRAQEVEKDKDRDRKGEKEKKIDQEQEKIKQRGEKKRDAEAKSALKEHVAKQARDKSEEEKLRKQQQKDVGLAEKRPQGAEKVIEATQKQTTEIKQAKLLSELKVRDDKKVGNKTDKDDTLGKGEKRETTAKDQKGLAEKRATQKEQEKLRKQQEKEASLGKKRAQEVEKDKDRDRKGEKEKKIDQEQEKIKQRGEKKRDAEAKSALEDHVGKQARDKSEEEKLRKQQQKDVGLAEKRPQGAEKVIEATQKPTTEIKQAKLLSELKVRDDKKVGNKTDKDDTLGKGEKRETTAKDQKANGDAMALLREQLFKQKQQELEKEKIRKEQEKEKELLAKKLKELESKKEAKMAVIKAPVLKTAHEDSVDEIIIDSTELRKHDEVTDIILGQKIYKVKCAKKTEDKTLILESEQPQKPGQYSEQITAIQEPELHKHEPELKQRFTQQKPGQPTLTQSQQKSSTSGNEKTKSSDSEGAKGVITYTLSDRQFIENGWTMLPTEKVVRKMNVYRMRPAKPEFDWFEHHKNKGELSYDSGEKLAEFDDNGRGRWYYRTGELALDYYDAEETNAGQRFVVYSTGQPDERGRSRPRTLLATFDYSGNGIVFDHTGKIRLKYNQTEGVVLDRTIGPVSHWKWHTLNDPPVLQQVMIETQMPYKDPTILAMGDKNADAKRPDNEEMLAIEFENFLKEKRQKLTQSFKPFQIKMKAMKINEYFSLRVLDQASIYLLFRDGTTNLKLNIGMLLDHKEIVDTDTAEIGEVSNTLDKLPACTDSIAELQKAVAKAQAQERFRVRHEIRLKPPQPTASADALRTGCSRPLRTPVVHASLSSCDKMTPKRFKPSSSCNLYYSTQFL